MNSRGSWRYIEVLWNETIALCKKMNIISNIITCNPNPQTNSPQWSLVHKWIILLNSKLTANVHFWVNYPFKVLVSGTSVSYSPTKIHFHKYNISIRLITIFVVDWTIIPQMATWLVAFLPVVSILAIKQRWMDLGSVRTSSEYVTEVTDEEHIVHMLKQSVKRTN